MKKINENLEKYLKKYRSTSSNLDIRNIKFSGLTNNIIAKDIIFQSINNKVDQKDTKTKNYKKKTTSINYIKSHHHRKRSSSYMMGSYIPSTNIFECIYDKDDNNNQNIQENNFKNIEHNNNKSKPEQSQLNNIDNFNNKTHNKTESLNIIINNDNKNNEIKQSKNDNKDKNIISSPESDKNINISFPSYDGNNSNNSVIVKQGENNENNNNLNKNTNNILEHLKLEDPNIFNNSKSFISFKNSLKYIKDKDERTTPSYQLALAIDKKNNNVNYVAASNVIEEEKSSMLDSEFSTKNDHQFFNEIKMNEDKKNFLIHKKNQNVNIDLSKLKKSQNAKINTFINNKCSIFKDKIKKLENDDNKKNNENGNNKMFLALNEIIIKNNRKEENRRKFLTNNKMKLLNTFFTMTKPLNISSNNNIFNNNLKPQIYVHTENSVSNQKIINDEIIKTNINFKKRQSINPRSNIINKEFIDNNISCNENTENNLIMSSIPKKNSSRIPHLNSTQQKSNRNIINEIRSINNNLIITTPFKKLDPKNINNNFSSSIKGKRNSAKNINNISKPQLSIKLNEEKNMHSLKRIENLNNALSFIREKNLLNKTNSNSRNLTSNNLNIFYYKKIQPLNSKNSNSNSKNNIHSSSSVNTHANSNTNNISGKNNKSLTNNNTNNYILNYNNKSLQRSKEKIKIRINYLRKANSGSFSNKGEYISNETIEGIDSSARGISNKNDVIFCLKYKIVFNKLYEKMDVFEKIKIINRCTRCFLIVLCEIKKNYFAFCGLFKYYNEKESFRKVYGDERCPGYILLKDIKNGNKYNIYEDKNKYDTSITSVKAFSLMEKFRFCNNCVIICKSS